MNMSFFKTIEQVKNKTKHETIRAGWNMLSPGDIVVAVEKCQGLKKGEKIKPICNIIIKRIDSIRVHEDYFTNANCTAEGFPGMPPTQFVNNVLIKGCKLSLGQSVKRITFDYVENFNVW